MRQLPRVRKGHSHRQMSMPKPVCPNMAAATPSARRNPDVAEAARRIARAGRAAIRRQHPSSLRARRGRSLPRCGELTFGTPTRHRAPDQEPGRILIPATEQPGIRGLRLGLPAWQWRLREACGLSRLNHFLALWSQAYMPSCNRRVTSTSIHMARPGPASAPRGHAPLYADTLSLVRTISDRRLCLFSNSVPMDCAPRTECPVLAHAAFRRGLIAHSVQGDPGWGISDLPGRR